MQPLKKASPATVGHLWLVDPIAQTLEVLRLEGQSYLLPASFGGSNTVRAEPFDAIELELGPLAKLQRGWVEFN